MSRPKICKWVNLGEVWTLANCQISLSMPPPPPFLVFMRLYLTHLHSLVNSTITITAQLSCRCTLKGNRDICGAGDSAEVPSMPCGINNLCIPCFTVHWFTVLFVVLVAVLSHVVITASVLVCQVWGYWVSVVCVWDDKYLTHWICNWGSVFILQGQRRTGTKFQAGKSHTHPGHPIHPQQILKHGQPY